MPWNPFARRGSPPGPELDDSRRGFLARLAGLAGGGVLLGGAPRAFATPAEVQAGQPFIGEILMVAFTFAPVGWLKCDGQLLPIAQYETLFTLVGTTYGGDGQMTFGIPDLRGRIPLHASNAGYVFGSSGGEPMASVLPGQLPSHGHPLMAATALAAVSTPAGQYPARDPANTLRFSGATPVTAMAASAVASTGAGQQHENMPPYLGIHFIIAYEGIYPTQN